MIVLVAVGIFVLLLLADGLYVAVQLRRTLREMGQHLTQGVDAFESGALSDAQRSFEAARRSSREARSYTAHPSLTLATFVPVVANDAEVADALPEVGDLTARAGLAATRAGTEVGATTATDLMREIFNDGRLNLGVLARAAPHIENANRFINDALDILEDRPAPATSLLRERYELVLSRLTSASIASRNATLLLDTLPPLLGSEGPRRYLLSFEANSEARATGGIIGLYGVLEAREGSVALTHVGPFAELFTDPRSGITSVDEAVELITQYDFLEPYVRPEGQSVEVNLSPNYPRVAKTLLDIFSELTGENLDGVLTTDPVTLAELLKSTGPVRVRGLPSPVTPDNAEDLLLRDSYLIFQHKPVEQARVLSEVIRSFYDGLNSSDVNAAALVTAIGQSAASQHLKFWVRDKDDEAALQELGAGGGLATSRQNVQMLFHNNLARNRVDVFLKRSFDVTVTVDSDGFAHIETLVTLRNTAPKKGPLSVTYDSNIPSGTNWMHFNAALPRTSEASEWWVNGERVEPTRTVENGFPVAGTVLRIAPGATEKVRIAYDLPNATDLLRGGFMHMRLVPQAGPGADQYTLTFVPPPGFRVIAVEPDGAAVGLARQYSGTLERVEDFSIRLDAV